MAGVAALARAAGHRVTGSDAAAWPPMSTQLESLGIGLMRGYEAAHLTPAPDVVIVGNVVSRGNPAVEHVLDIGLPYVSGPQWLAENVLRGRHVLAVAGTHGKTTTASLLAWMLEHAGLAPGFLIGGVPRNFGVSARLGSGKFFVVEADEYDTAFFDKRSKFVHYGPRTLVLNNLEFDHADIFPDLASIERQFHHLVRTVPGSGRILSNARDAALTRVLAQGIWSEVERFNDPKGWSATLEAGELRVCFDDKPVATGPTPLAGEHNASNALAAIAAAAHVGVPPQTALDALASFENVSRRLERIGEARGVTVYDDFAHHPTAIAATIEALRSQVGGRILAVLEPRSNTMRLGVHAQALAESLRDADAVYVFQRPDLQWDALGVLGAQAVVHEDLDRLVADLAKSAKSGDRLLFMSNGDFGGVHARMLAALRA